MEISINMAMPSPQQMNQMMLPSLRQVKQQMSCLPWEPIQMLYLSANFVQNQVIANAHQKM